MNGQSGHVSDDDEDAEFKGHDRPEVMDQEVKGTADMSQIEGPVLRTGRTLPGIKTAIVLPGFAPGEKPKVSVLNEFLT